jgi:thiol:disulfide interchange protein DsbD
VSVRLVAEAAELVPGRENWLALEFTIESHWHLYWDGRNDSGMPPTVEWTLPEGFKTGAVVWPAPKRLALPGGLLDHVYEDRLTLLVPLSVPADAKPGPVRVAGDLKWLVCSDVCLQGDGHVSGEFVVGADASAEPKQGKDAKVFAAARARVPQPLPKPTPADPGPVRVTWKAGEVEIHVPGAEKLAFYPGHESSPLRDIVADGEVKGDRLRIRLNTDHDGPVRLAGVLDAAYPKPRPGMIWKLDLVPERGGSDSGG